MRWLEFRRQRKRRKLARKGFAQTDKIRRRETSGQLNGTDRARTPVFSVFLFLLIWAVCSLSIAYRLNPPAPYFLPGQPADRNVYSEIGFEYEDLDQTYRRREHAAATVPPVYAVDDGASEEALAALSLLSGIADPQAPDAALPEAETLGPAPPLPADLRNAFRRLTETERKTLTDIVLTPAKWRVLVDLVTDAVHRGLLDPSAIAELRAREPVITKIAVLARAGGVERRSEMAVTDLRSPADAADEVAAAFAQGYPDTESAIRDALRKILPILLRTNLVYDIRSTQRARKAAAATVPVVKRFVPANTVLLRRGQTVREEDIHILKRHQQELHGEDNLRRYIDDHFIRPVLCLILLGAACYCLKVARPQVYDDRSLLVMITIILILQIVLNRVVLHVYPILFGSSFFLFSLLPLSFAAVLASPLMGLRTALLGGTFTTAVAALQTGSSRPFQLFLVGIISSLVGAAIMRRASKRSHALQMVVGITVSVFVIELLFALQGSIPLATLYRVIPSLLTCTLLNGLAVAGSVSLMQWLFEWGFGVTTERTLVELNDLNHPLLKRLQLEAPGTYHHSLMVATLAEQAAEAIGANPLLARVCAYFHDIGKLAHPEYFTENSRGGNPHSDLQPRMSALVILNHVKEGIDLALKYKLKRPIREAIAQHHGTSLVFYFYRRAVDQHASTGAGTHVGEQDYRYPGPRPQRKEISLLSIADACEAAARSLEKPSPQKISALVDEIINKRVRDHQLDHADLTFGELAKAREQISKTLTLMLHGRVRYPEEYDNETDLFQAAAQAAVKKPKTTADGNRQSNGAERT